MAYTFQILMAVIDGIVARDFFFDSLTFVLLPVVAVSIGFNHLLATTVVTRLTTYIEKCFLQKATAKPFKGNLSIGHNLL